MHRGTMYIENQSASVFIYFNFFLIFCRHGCTFPGRVPGGTDAWTATCVFHGLTHFPLRPSVYRATLPCNLRMKLPGPRALGQWPRGHPTPAAEPNAMMQGDCSSRWTVQLARPVIERQLDILSLLGGATLYIEDGIYFCAYRAAYNTRRA